MNENDFNRISSAIIKQAVDDYRYAAKRIKKGDLDYYGILFEIDEFIKGNWFDTLNFMGVNPYKFIKKLEKIGGLTEEMIYIKENRDTVAKILFGADCREIKTALKRYEHGVKSTFKRDVCVYLDTRIRTLNRSNKKTMFKAGKKAALEEVLHHVRRMSK